MKLFKGNSYESWLRSQGAYELANQLNAGDRPAKGNEAECLAEDLTLPWYAAQVEDLFKRVPSAVIVKINAGTNLDPMAFMETRVSMDGGSK